MSKKLFIIVIIILLPFGVKSQGKSGLFIENKGQFPAEVKYYTTFKGGALFIEEKVLTYVFQHPESQKSTHLHEDNRSAQEINESYVVKVNFLESATEPIVNAGRKRPTTFNYFIGSDSRKWISGAEAYKEVFIENLYEGIDLKLSTNNGHVKYDLLLRPGANPSCIRMKYEGADDLQIDDNELSYTIPYGRLKERIPASYAISAETTREIESSYYLEGDVVSFTTEMADHNETVQIDPVLVFSTYSGSSSDNWGNTATFDDDGNAYSGGITINTRGENYIGDFPATPGAYQGASGGGWDVAISKYDSTGANLLYATYLGGEGTDVPQSLIVDDNGDLLILGVTSSADFPTSTTAYDTSFNGGQNATLIRGVNMTSGSDLFVTKLSGDGSTLLGSTYIGGQLNDGMLSENDDLARNYGDESRGDINFDTNRNIIIASRTASPDFPAKDGYDNTFNGNTDAVVLKLTENLDSLIWSSYLGGIETDVALSVKVDSKDNIYVAGGTSSSNFPVTDSVYMNVYGGNVDGWIANLTPDGDSLLASTYIGTNAYDQTFFLDLDGSGNVYVAGQTMANYSITNGKFSSGSTGQFIHKLSGTLRESIFSTVLGAAGSTMPNISLTAFLVNECDNIYLSGWGSNLTIFNDYNNFTTNTADLPVTADAYQLTSDGSSFYLAVLSGDASELLYATHLGGASAYVHVDGGTSRFDKHGIVYHSVCASCADNDSSFPTTEGAYAEENASIGCSNAIFKFDLASLRARIQTNNIALDDPGLNGGCLPLPVVFENLTTAGQVYDWDFGDGNTRTVYTKDTVLHYYRTPGVYAVQLRAYDPNTCIAEDYAYTTISVADPVFSLSDDSNICFGQTARLIATGGTSYQWFPETGLDNPNSGSPLASPGDTTTYTVQITNTNGCDFQGSVTVNVIPQIQPDIKLEQVNLCEGSRTIELINNSKNVDYIEWSFGDGTFDEGWEPEHNYSADGQYHLTATLNRDICQETVELDLNLVELNIPNVLTRNNDGFNDVLKISSAVPVGLTIYTRWGTTVYKSAQYNNDWDGSGLNSGIYFYEALLYNGEVCSGWIHLLNDN